MILLGFLSLKKTFRSSLILIESQENYWKLIFPSHWIIFQKGRKKDELLFCSFFHTNVEKKIFKCPRKVKIHVTNKNVFSFIANLNEND